MGVQSKLKKCNTQCWITFLLLTLNILVTVNGAPKCPPGGTFSDKHTGRTECCDGICKHAKITGMEQECNSNCPNYKPSVQIKLEDIFKAPPDTGAVEADSSSATNLPVILSVIAVVTILAVLLVAVITKVKLPCGHARPPQRVEDQHELQEMEEAGERFMNDGQADQTQPQQIEGPGHAVSVPEQAGRAADVNRENDQNPALVLLSGRQEEGPQYPENRPAEPHHEAQPVNYPIRESGDAAPIYLTAALAP
ncbi:hypothetical protein V1264_018986 [Littorina saxatilis]|uniref:Uncharacterized protein n=2 Tax=Littorina saxatilis TaxID=31220 RepID=A0AAN9BEZ2_9CAEN